MSVREGLRRQGFEGQPGAPADICGWEGDISNNNVELCCCCVCWLPSDLVPLLRLTEKALHEEHDSNDLALHLHICDLVNDSENG